MSSTAQVWWQFGEWKVDSIYTQIKKNNNFWILCRLNDISCLPKHERDYILLINSSSVRIVYIIFRPSAKHVKNLQHTTTMISRTLHRPIREIIWVHRKYIHSISRTAPPTCNYRHPPLKKVSFTQSHTYSHVYFTSPPLTCYLVAEPWPTPHPSFLFQQVLHPPHTFLRLMEREARSHIRDRRGVSLALSVACIHQQTCCVYCVGWTGPSCAFEVAWHTRRQSGRNSPCHCPHRREWGPLSPPLLSDRHRHRKNCRRKSPPLHTVAWMSLNLD